MNKYWIVTRPNWYQGNGYKITGQIIKEYLHYGSTIEGYYNNGKSIVIGSFCQNELSYLGGLKEFLEATDF
jgi:hypothetical protein